MDVNLTVKSTTSAKPIEKAKSVLFLFKSVPLLSLPHNPQLVKQVSAKVICLKKCPPATIVEHLIVPLVKDFFQAIGESQSDLATCRKKRFRINSGLMLIKVANQGRTFAERVLHNRSWLLPTKALWLGLNAQLDKIDCALSMETDSPEKFKAKIAAISTVHAMLDGGDKRGQKYRKNNEKLLAKLLRWTNFYSQNKYNNLLTEQGANNQTIQRLEQELKGLEWVNDENLPTENQYLKAVKHLCPDPAALKILQLALFDSR